MSVLLQKTKLIEYMTGCPFRTPLPVCPLEKFRKLNSYEQEEALECLEATQVNDICRQHHACVAKRNFYDTL